MVARRRAGVWPGAVGGQHGRFAARPAGAAADRHRARPHRRWLADRRGPGDGAGAGAAAGACGPFGRRRSERRRPGPVDGAWPDPGQGDCVRRLDAGCRAPVIPWVLHAVAHTGSRELFRLAVLAIALGVAFGAAKLFGVSLALGAFFAGMIMSESELSHRAAEESLPLRDAFSVLFFVSVGMLFDPFSLMSNGWPILATLAIIVIGKSLAAFVIVIAFRYPLGTALMISASLAQIGEFSFILAELGVGLKLLPQ